MHKPDRGVNGAQVCLLSILSLEGVFSPTLVKKKKTGRPITFLECVEANSVGAGKLNLTCEYAEAVKDDYFCLPFKRRLS